MLYWLSMAKTISLKPTKCDDDDLMLFPGAAHLPPVADHAHPDDGWLSDHEEGRLAVDVSETDHEIIVASPIAGVRPEDLEVFVHNDMLTIRGTRTHESEVKEGRRLVRECHWGSFSRSIILPAEIDAERISATLKNGVLTIRMPKVERSKKISVKEL